MRPLLAVFLIFLSFQVFSQQKEAPSNNTLEVAGFSVVSDSLSVVADTLAVAEEPKISRRDSLLFLSFPLPKPEIFTAFNTYEKSENTYLIAEKGFTEYASESNHFDRDTRTLPAAFFVQLLDSFSLERTRYEQKIIRMRQIAQKPIKEMNEVTIEDYKIFYSDGKATHVDTTLSINKDYRFNYLRKDYFELLTFPNTGEAYNRLGYDFQDQKITPDLGARAKHFAYMEEEEIPYFEVPSPLTELFFKTVFEQGQMVDALISVNTSPRLNLTFAHKAYRSLGKYINTLGGATNLRFSSQYTSKNYRYRQRSHFAAQRLENQANGGLDSLSVFYFEKAIEVFQYDGFLDRSRLTNNVGVNNTLVGRRYYLDQQYDAVLGGGEKMKNYEKPKVLTIGHKINFEGKHFGYDNTKSNAFFGTVTGTANFGIRTQLDVMDNEVYAIYNEKNLGQLKAGIRLIQWDYNITLPENKTNSGEPFDFGPNPTEIQAGQLALSAYWKKTFLKFDFIAEGYFSSAKDYASQFTSAEIQRTFNNGFHLMSKLSLRSQAPNFNFFLHRSNYEEYDWYNPSFKNQLINSLKLSLGHPRWGNFDGLYEILNNYTYFRNLPPVRRQVSYYFETRRKQEELIVAPEQYEGSLHYLKLRYFHQLDFWKFSLANTAQYQKVTPNGGSSNFQPLNVPEWNLRSSFFFSSELFNKALYLQTGVTAQYFTKYYADRYSAHLGEFAAQNHTKIGDFPRLDFFINAKIQQTRLYLKYEHFNSNTTGYNFYAAPFTPYRDAVVRFGVVWNFFQ
jgi:hypothetical protein